MQNEKNGIRDPANTQLPLSLKVARQIGNITTP